MAKQIAKTLDEAKQLWPEIPVGKAKNYSNYKQKYLTLLYRTTNNFSNKNRPQGNVQWVAKCECGNYIKISPNNLETRVSCGCKRKEGALPLIKDIQGQTFNYLLVLEKTEQRVRRNVVWKCQCLKCGNIKYATETDLRRSNVISCGCQKSQGEQQIKKFLDIKNIKYKQEYSFSDLKYIRPLRFDFALLDSNDNLLGLIEFQGRQHYTNEKWGTTQREITDPMKKEYCSNHQIPLYEIKYNDNLEVMLEKIWREVYGN